MINKILPFENLVYSSTLNKEDLIVHLGNQIETEKSFGLGAINYSYSKPYIGKIENNTFEIKRAINYRNSFLPQIKGEIINGINGSKINVKMQLITIVKFFMIFWLGIVSFVCLGIIYNLIGNINEFNIETSMPIFIPFFMLIFGVGIVLFGFKIESKRSIKDLEEILKAKIVETR